MPSFNDLILFPTRGVLFNADAMGVDATANPHCNSQPIHTTPGQRRKKHGDSLLFFFRSRKGKWGNVSNIDAVKECSKQKRERKKKKAYDTHLHVTLKLAYHRMFWPVSGKGRRRPFCPDDEWAGLTGHFSLPLPLSLSFSRYLHPVLFLLPLHHPLQREATICFLRLGARRRIPPGDRFIGIGTR